MNSTGADPLPRRRDLRAWRERRARRLRTLRRVVGVSAVVALGAVAVVASPVLRDETGAVHLAGLPDRVTALADRGGQTVSRSSSREGEPQVSAAAEGSDPHAADTAAPPGEVAAPAPAPADPAQPPAEGAPVSPDPAAQEPPPAEPPVPSGATAAEEFAASLTALTNEQRLAGGLATLATSGCAASQAVERAALLVAEGRFEHDPLGPVLGACGGRTVGENLALGHRTPADMTAGWMGSAGHRANILRVSHTSIGVGCVEGPRGMLCAQVFLG
ncbi:CAP domain-containing protein [Cellulomonas chengniuliangii]|uniref:CAP domain-containing protein n=1 Tax=Cellulomonas chengniuliangii TaxID=2968084 RepID=A0ABY5L294_9CELL|nr:CAP domain-containing protein [Cellulomonas chengniuliangii]MCC2307235.1 CAP domain-containing protein [Cellulomonas chengniuliangii]UUI75969.1 CAP domain-containing protein [Cellulomonas chengniuliangii]